MAVFSIDEARSLLPRIREVTDGAVRRVDVLAKQAEDLDEGDPLRDQLGAEIQRIVQHWADEVQGLGAEVKGLWLVDFDSGEGYYCWKHPEEELDYFHTYEGGFQGRRLIQPEMLH